MIEQGILILQNWVLWWMSLWHGVLYLVPAVTVLIVYTLRSIRNIREDRAAVIEHNKKMGEWNALSEDIQQNGPLRKPTYNRKHTTIGFILGRWFIAVLPVINLFPFFFDCLGGIIDECVDFLRKTFNINIIAKPMDD